MGSLTTNSSSILSVHSPVLARPLSDSIRCAHLVGICGSGMQALAELLLDQNCRVTGSDLRHPTGRLARQKSRRLTIHLGHHGEFVPNDADVLVFSPAVGPNNPERQFAARSGIPQLSYSQMLGHLMRGRTGIVVTGTHGKSTTTAMTASILRSTSAGASAIVGAELCGLETSGWAGSGSAFVVEGCEYKKSFLDLRATHAAILGIEPDHFDFYPTLDDLIRGFAEFVATIPAEGTLLIPSECPVTRSAARDANCSVSTFSTSAAADWCAHDIRRVERGTRFRVFHRNDFFAEMFVPIPGRHTIHNALAATALCAAAGASPREIIDGLAEFRGIHRRFERIGWWRGISLVDDYAHHPTAVRATLETARTEFGKRRIWCVFQPHQISRTRALLNEFASSFDLADEVLIAPVYAAREGTLPEAVSASKELATRVNLQGQSARFFASLDRIVATLDDEARPGDVLMTMGAGDIDRVHHEFTRRLQRHHSA